MIPHQDSRAYSKHELNKWARYVAPRQRHGREHAVEAMSDWGIRQERNADRSAKTDPLIAFATFVHGTITPGCGCEECDSRRDLVMTLIYNKDLDTEKLDRAVYDGPSTKGLDYNPDACRVCGRTHYGKSRVMNTEMNYGCYQRYMNRNGRRLRLLLFKMHVAPKRRFIGSHRNLLWLAENLQIIRNDHELLGEALELVQVMIDAENAKQRLLATG